MAIQYAGAPNVNTIFTGDTRQNIVEGIHAQLLNAGWTDVTPTQVGDRTVQSALTGQSLQCRCRIYDPGVGNNSARVRFQNVTGSQIGADLFLLPFAAKTFRIIANKFQFFTLVPGSVQPRDFVCGGVPFLETFLTTGPAAITEAIWSQGNAQNDIDVTIRGSFRNRSHTAGGLTWQDVNSNGWTNATGGGAGGQRLVVPIGQTDFFADNTGRVWHTDEAFKIPARIAWGLSSVADAAKVRGQLWDAVVVSQDYTADLTTTFDAHNWFNMTSSNVTDYANASLWVVIP